MDWENGTRVASNNGTIEPQGKNAVNQALIYEWICSRESRAKSMIDFTVKSMKNLLDKHAEITQNIYQLILLRINCNIHCKIHKNHQVICLSIYAYASICLTSATVKEQA